MGRRGSCFLTTVEGLGDSFLLGLRAGVWCSPSCSLPFSFHVSTLTVACCPSGGSRAGCWMPFDLSLCIFAKSVPGQFTRWRVHLTEESRAHVIQRSGSQVHVEQRKEPFFKWGLTCVNWDVPGLTGRDSGSWHPRCWAP